jgi:hypothetical protein
VVILEPAARTSETKSALETLEPDVAGVAGASEPESPDEPVCEDAA